MKFELCYPNWKEKAVTFSYDDGQIYDRHLVEIFNYYGLKGTFHLNSGILGKKGFVSAEEAGELYKGHEIACHGKEHHYPTHLCRELLLKEFYEDKVSLEKITGEFVRGCSYAFGEYNEQVINLLEDLGIIYSRTVKSTGAFSVPVDFMQWHPTCHHNDAFNGEIIQRFLHKPEYQKLPLLYIWGHSFEFEREKTWGKMEKLCEKISNDENAWYTTNIDYAEYMKAAKSLVFSLSGEQVKNLSKIPVYVKIDGIPQIL